MTAKIQENMCRILTEKYNPPEIQNLLRKATISTPRYGGSMEDAEVLDDVKHHEREKGSGESGSSGAAVKLQGHLNHQHQEEAE